MKTTIAIMGVCVVFYGQALAQTNRIATNAPIAKTVGSSNEIVTVNGDVYKQVKIEKIDPSGIVITYSVAGGGLSIARLKFTDLPEQIQKRCGYDLKKAEAFKLLEVQAAIELRQKLLADEIVRQQFAAAREESDFQERKLHDLERERANLQQQQNEVQKKMAEAALRRAEQPPIPPQQINIIQNR